MLENNKYPFILTGFSECMKGVFKDNLPPQTIDDVLVEIQAIVCHQVGDTLRGNMLIIVAREDFGDEPFDIQFYLEKRDPPYRTIGYKSVRTLKNVRLVENISKDNTDYHDKFIEYTAESDTGWEEIDFLYKQEETN